MFTFSEDVGCGPEKVTVLMHVDIDVSTERLDEIVDHAVDTAKRNMESLHRENQLLAQRRRVQCRITRGLTNETLIHIDLPPIVGTMNPTLIEERVQGAFADLGEG